MTAIPEHLNSSRLAAWLQRVPAGLRGKMRLARFVADRLLDPAAPCRVGAVDGLDLMLPNLRDSVGLCLFADGVYEGATIDWIQGHLSPAGTLLDIGANIGSIALPLAARRRDVRVICVEASPLVFEFLHRNIIANGFAGRVDARHCALSASDASHIAFYSPDEGYGKGSMSPVFTQAAVQVPNLRLDEFLGSLGSDPGLLKIDVEGFEKQVLEGGMEFLKRRRPEVIFEFCDWAERLAGNAPGDSQRFLLELGYSLYRLGDGSPLSGVLVEGFEMILARPAAANPGSRGPG